MEFEDTMYDSFDQAEQQVLKAFELYENGKIQNAITEIDKALEINPANSAWHFNKALALDAAGRFDDAIHEFEIALQLNPDDTEILNSLAVDYTRLGLYDLAIQTFEQIESIDPDFEPSYCNRIITYTEMNMHELAEKMFYIAQQINPDCALCFYNIGNSLFVRQQYKKAVFCWQKTAQLEPTHPQINFRIAQAYWMDGDISNARKYFLAELKKNPADKDVLLDFGIFLMQNGHIEQAQEKFNRMLELDGDCASAHFYLGEIAFNERNYTKAVELFRLAIEGNPALQGPRYRLALCLLADNLPQKALPYLASELQLEPENPSVLLSMASIFLQFNELDFATKCLIKTLELDNSNAEAFYYLGCVNILKGQLNIAKEFLLSAVKFNPKHKAALVELAHLYLKIGNAHFANEKIKQAIDCGKNTFTFRKFRYHIFFARLAQTLKHCLTRFK